MSSALVSAKPPCCTALSTSYCAIGAVKFPVIVAVPTEKNCTVEPSASDAVTPFSVTSGSVKESVVSAATTILPCGCVSAAGMSSAYVVQQAHRIARPSDRDHRRGECIFEQQQRAHDPGAEFADGGVRIGVRRTGDREHRGELRVTQARERADHTGDDERQDHGGSGVQRRGRAGAYEDAGADDAADAEQHQVNRSERAFQLAAIELGLDLSNGLGTPTHRAPREFEMGRSVWWRPALCERVWLAYPPSLSSFLFRRSSMRRRSRIFTISTPTENAMAKYR